MTTIQQVIDAIAGLLEEIDGLQVHREPPGTLVTPAAAVALGPGSYRTTSSGTNDATYLIDVFTSAASPQGMQNLYAYVDSAGDSSIVAKFAADPTLGGVVDYAQVTDWDKPNRTEVGQSEQYHIEITVAVSVLGDLE